MSNAWDMTNDDINHVLHAHDTSVSILENDVDFSTDDLEYNEIEDAILSYTDFDDQIDCMHSEIEDQLIKMDMIEGPKLFNRP
jgi:hypothetical protein